MKSCSRTPICHQSVSFDCPGICLPIVQQDFGIRPLLAQQKTSQKTLGRLPRLWKRSLMPFSGMPQFYTAYSPHSAYHQQGRPTGAPCTSQCRRCFKLVDSGCLDTSRRCPRPCQGFASNDFQPQRGWKRPAGRLCHT